MYNFIFYFVYVQNIKKDGNKGAKALGAVTIYFALLGQTFSLFVLYQYFYQRITLKSLLNQNNIQQKSINITPVVILALLLMVFIYFYYSDKMVLKIKKKYSNKDKFEFCTSLNTIKFLLLFITPWIIAIVLG
jgi:uncharacterized membrane-anchored protein